MDWIDRQALLVRPKRRFFEWANRLEPADPKLTLEDAYRYSAVFLIAAEQDENDRTSIIDQYAEQLFEEVLAGWTEDEGQWPVNRTPHLFRDWFDVELIGHVMDADDDLPLSLVGELDDEDGKDGDRAEPLAECAWCLRAIPEDAPCSTISFQRFLIERLCVFAPLR